MQPRTLERIDPTLVHKAEPGNVLLADLRLAVPAWLATETLVDIANRDPAAGAFLNQRYAPAAPFFERPESVAGWNVLSTLLPFVRIEAGELERRVVAAGAEEELPELRRIYDAHGEVLLMRRDVSESMCERLLEAVGLGSAVMSIDEKLRLSSALEHLDDPPRAYCARIVVDIKHGFFFEHPIDHVPALLIIEAARQMGLAAELRFRKAQRQAQFILMSMGVEFKGYVDLCLPLDVYSTEVCGTAERAERRVAEFDIVVRQLNRDAAVFRVTGQRIPPAVFERMRRHHPAMNGRLFVPRPEVSPAVTLHPGNSTVLDGAAAALWVGGMVVSFPRHRAVGLRSSDECGVTLRFPEIGEIRTGARVVEQWCEGDRWVLILEMLGAGRAEQDRYQRAIAMHCVWSGESAPLIAARSRTAVATAA